MLSSHHGIKTDGIDMRIWIYVSHCYVMNMTVVVDIFDVDQLVTQQTCSDGRGAGVFTGRSRRRLDATWSCHARRLSVWLHCQVVCYSFQLCTPGRAGTRTSLDFTGARDGDSGISWAICKSALRPRQITTPALDHSVFYRPDSLPAAQPSVKALKALNP